MLVVCVLGNMLHEHVAAFLSGSRGMGSLRAWYPAYATVVVPVQGSACLLGAAVQEPCVGACVL